MIPRVAQEEALPAALDPWSLLNALPTPVLLVGPGEVIHFLNSGAEHFFSSSRTTLGGRSLEEILPPASPIFSLVAKAREDRRSITEYALTIETPRVNASDITVFATPLPEQPEMVILTLQSGSMARKLDDKLLHRGAARSVTAMAAMLAHEVKNPLSGIRGAAQLLEQDLGAEDRALTRLICDETDRIVALVIHMEMFSDERPIAREAVNIHEVLDHVRGVAHAGFARHVRFLERYDPSLPAVLGNRDLLIQVFLNLVKNAAEAVPREDGRIILETRYQQGVRLKLSGSGALYSRSTNRRNC